MWVDLQEEKGNVQYSNFSTVFLTEYMNNISENAGKYFGGQRHGSSGRAPA
jgi:hypothetical protein